LNFRSFFDELAVIISQPDLEIRICPQLRQSSAHTPGSGIILSCSFFGLRKILTEKILLTRLPITWLSALQQFFYVSNDAGLVFFL
jgi:hypothetical protein